MSLLVRVTALAQAIAADIKALTTGKVSVVDGKGLSTNDYTTLEKNKLATFDTAITLASAATVAIGAAAANTVNITGTTAITAFDTVTAGIRRVVTFADALVLTHNATSLVLPYAANITTVAGDTAEFESLGGGNWKCLWYTRSTAAAVKAALNLDQVSNTGDTVKPVSTPQQAALDLKADKDSPSLTGVPLAPTPAVGTNSTQIQTAAGALAQIQAFGLGVSALPIPVSDLNTTMVSQLLRGGGSLLNKPANTSAIVGMHLPYSTTYTGQFAFGLTGSDAGKFFYRTQLGGVQGDWSAVAPLASPTLTGSVQVAADTLTLPHLSAALLPALRASGFAGAGSAAIAVSGYSYSTNTFAAAYWGTRSAGAVGAHGALATGRAVLSLIGAGSDGAAYQRLGQIDFYTADAVSSTASPGEIRFLTTPAGSVTPTLGMTLSAAKSLTVVGAIVSGSTLTAAGPVKCGQYTLSTLPSASAYSGYEIDVTDATGGSKRCRSNGTNWLILNTTTIVS